MLISDLLQAQGTMLTILTDSFAQSANNPKDYRQIFKVARIIHQHDQHTPIWET